MKVAHARCLEVKMTPPRTIALIGKYKSPSIIESLCLLASNLDERGIEVIVEEGKEGSSKYVRENPCMGHPL